MKEFIIMWNAGYGEDAELVMAESLEEAQRLAYEAWREEAENNSDYSAMEATDELKEEYGLLDE